MLIALVIRFVAVAIAIVAVVTLLFMSGRFCLAPEQPGVFRHQPSDWACPRCDRFGQLYVSRLWRARARRRAAALAHTRVSPNCPAATQELVVLS